MNASLHSNVFYLPLRSDATDESRPSHRMSLWMRATLAWWRVRVTARELWSVLRRGGRHWSTVEDSFMLSRSAGSRSRPRYAVPARVIDFESAKKRLRI